MPTPFRSAAIPRRRFVRSALALCAALALLPAPALAQEVKPWVPSRDSLRLWADQAKAGFQANQGDSIGGGNYRAYEYVGLMARRLLRSLGPGATQQAPAIEPVLDSLGLETSVAVDPQQTGFALVMVRNPYRWTAHAVGFLCWWKGDDLRMQGAEFGGGTEPRMRVWWRGLADRPYEWAIVDRTRGEGTVYFTLLRLTPSGNYWNLAQDSEHNAILGRPGEAAFTDVNRDGIPELTHWWPAKTDSLLIPCSDCPKLTNEDLYVSRQEGFVLEDSRLIPTAYATFTLFIRLLLDKDRTAAARLLREPADVTKAVAEGWGVARKPGTWRIEYVESGEAWPRWMEARFDGPQGVKRYMIRFTERSGRWIIDNWVEPKPAPRTRTGAR